MVKIELQTLNLFLDWTKKKVGLHLDDRPIHVAEREIWWASLGQNIGTEVNGKHRHFERPVIVLKKVGQNMLFAIPASTVIKSGSWYFTFSFHGKAMSALLAQCRPLSCRRMIRKMGSIDTDIFLKIQTAFIAFIKTDPPILSEDPRGLLRGDSGTDPSVLSGGSSGPLAGQCIENILINENVVNR